MTEEVFHCFFKAFSPNRVNLDAFLSCRRISDYAAYAAGFYKKNSPFIRKERVKRLKEDILENETLKEDVLQYHPVGIYQKMFYKEYIRYHE